MRLTPANIVSVSQIETETTPLSRVLRCSVTVGLSFAQAGSSSSNREVYFAEFDNADNIASGAVPHSTRVSIREHSGPWRINSSSVNMSESTVQLSLTMALPTRRTAIRPPARPAAPSSVPRINGEPIFGVDPTTQAEATVMVQDGSAVEMLGADLVHALRDTMHTAGEARFGNDKFTHITLDMSGEVHKVLFAYRPEHRSFVLFTDDGTIEVSLTDFLEALVTAPDVKGLDAKPVMPVRRKRRSIE